MNLRLTACDDDRVWDDFVERSLQGSVFCQSAFMAALGKPVERWLLSEDEWVVAAYPVLMNGIGAPAAAPHAYTLYQGLMFHSDIDLEAPHRGVQHKLKLTDFLLEELSLRYSRISLCTHPQLDDIRSFLWFNYHRAEKGVFQAHTRYTGLLSLENFDQQSYLSQVRSLRKREFARATRDGYRVVESTDVAALDRLHELTFARQGLTRSPSEVALLRSITEGALKQGFGQCMTAVNGAGEIASANLILFDKRTAYYLIGANHPDFRSSGASTYLMCAAIERAASMGLKHFDFVGVNSPDRGDYKLSFNARPVLYHTLDWQKPSDS
ncbi:MAG: GNAT family N-acetyltransferase [Candidatus Obscuribacterales bacterium]